MTLGRLVIVVLALGLLIAPLGVEARSPAKLYRIGVLSPFSSSFGPGPSFEAFRHTLRELGYVEDRTVALEYRWADGRADRLPGLFIRNQSQLVTLAAKSRLPAMSGMREFVDSGGLNVPVSLEVCRGVRLDGLERCARAPGDGG